MASRWVLLCAVSAVLMVACSQPTQATTPSVFYSISSTYTNSSTIEILKHKNGGCIAVMDGFYSGDVTVLPDSMCEPTNG